MVKTPDANRNNEIDLVDLLLKTVITIRSNFWLIILFFVLGCGLGAAYFMTARKQYQSKMIISSNILTTSYAKVLFDNINDHLLEGEYSVVASDLKLTEDMARQIAGLEIENLTKTEGNAIKESDRYLITARIYDNQVLPNIQRGIVEYLENNEFVKVRVSQQRTFLKEMIASLDQELNELKQFKSDLYSGKFFSTAKGNMMFDPTAVNTKVLELTQKKIEFQHMLELSSSVQMIEGLTPFSHVEKPRLITSLIAGSMIGLFAVGALIAFKSIRHLLRLADAKNIQHAA
jgi:hypothetical protein